MMDTKTDHGTTDYDEDRRIVDIQHGFVAAQLHSRFARGEYRFGVRAGIVIIQDGLSEFEAGQLAEILNRGADGFRELCAIIHKQEQLGLSFVNKR